MKNGAANGQSVNYRCPQCHYMVEQWILFGIACPVCGWKSPLHGRRDRRTDELCNHIDVHYDGGTVRVTTELTGVDDKDIALEVGGNILTISVGDLDRIVLLRHDVGQNIARTYRNGVLEITLRQDEGG